MLRGEQVLTKTPKGISEVYEQADDILPREARTLLILINGQMTVDEYRSALGARRAFIVAGGVDQLLQLLLDLDYATARPLEGTSAVVEEDLSDEEIVLREDITQLSSPVPTLSAPVVQEASPTVTVAQETRAAPRPVSRPNTSLSLEALRSALAEMLERDKQIQDSWSWLFQLEKCSEPEDFLFFLDELEKVTKRVPRNVAKLARELRDQFE